jgi:Ankyrin repeats (3 copies)
MKKITAICVVLINRLDAETQERDPQVPAIFNNALHMAILHNAVDVAWLFLKYGLEPDQQGARPIRDTTFFRDQNSNDQAPAATVISPEIWHAAPIHKSPICKTLPRQRSFSLNSELDVSITQRFLNERRSVSLKSRPNIASPQWSHHEDEDNTNHLRPVERSIFAELRRSSDIFKSILLNLSLRENSTIKKADEDGVSYNSAASPETMPVDLVELLAAHEQRRLAAYQHDACTHRNHLDASYLSESSACSSDMEDHIGGHNTSQQEILASNESTSLLRLNMQLSAEKVQSLQAHAYTRSFLLTLPPLFLACVKGNASMLALLLKYGANANSQDDHGNTPLHLCLCQASIPWECVLDLLEHGAQISLENNASLTPYHLAPSSLAKLQIQMLLDCWTAFRLTTLAAPVEPQQSAVGDLSSPQPTEQNSRLSQTVTAPFSKSQGILRRIHEGLRARTDSEEATTTSAEALPGVSSAGSVKNIKGSSSDVTPPSKHKVWRTLLISIIKCNCTVLKLHKHPLLGF